MFFEFFAEVSIIKIKVSGYIEKISDKSKEIFENKAIFNNHELKFSNKDTNYFIDLRNKSIKLIRENENMKQYFIFDKNKETKCEYYIKEYHISIDFEIITSIINVNDQSIYIEYKVKDTLEKYIFKLEMSDKI